MVNEYIFKGRGDAKRNSFSFIFSLLNGFMWVGWGGGMGRDGGGTVKGYVIHGDKQEFTNTLKRNN